MVTIIHNAAKCYETEFCHKNLLIIFGAPCKPSYIQTASSERNFLHLTGVISQLKGNNASELFYAKAIDGNLSVDDFEINPDGTTQLKMEVINQALNISCNAKMIGDYNNGRIKLQTNKIAGSTASCIGFIKDNGYYVPNTILCDDTRSNVIESQRIIAILSKNVSESQYEKTNYVAKKIEIKPLLTKLAKDVPINKSLYQDNDTLESRIADKITTISTNAVCNNPRNLIELYELTKQGSVYNTSIERICIENGHAIQTFDAYLHKTAEIEYAYDKFETTEEKPDFKELRERLDKFLTPFIHKECETLTWSPTAAIWERQMQSNRAISEKQSESNTEYNTESKIKSDKSDASETTTGNTGGATQPKNTNENITDTKYASKLARLNATIANSSFAPPSTLTDDFTNYFSK